jgi:segregation and condensation protein A
MFTKLSTHKIQTSEFSGPLDLLLHLIERNELDITSISLAHVTEQYLAQVERMTADRVSYLMDFLVIGAKLLVIKSRALLPQESLLPPDEEEEDPAEELARQLKLYKRFKAAAIWLQTRERNGLRSFLRVASHPKLETTLDLVDITVFTLKQALKDVLARGQMLEDSVSVAVERQRITIESQIARLTKNIKDYGQVFFTELLSTGQITRLHVSVTLLAVLELIKRNEVTVYQPSLYGPIEIRAFEQNDQIMSNNGKS